MRQFSLLVVLLVTASTTSFADDFKPEDGFVLLFNGKDLTGWKTSLGDSLDGKTAAFNGRFKAADGVLTIDPKVKGDVRIETKKVFGNDVHIKFEFNPGEDCNNDLILRGQKFDLKKPDVKNMKVGEWNTFEIVIDGDKSEFKCNGETMRTATLTGKGTVFVLRAELGAMQVRRLRVKD